MTPPPSSGALRSRSISAWERGGNRASDPRAGRHRGRGGIHGSARAPVGPSSTTATPPAISTIPLTFSTVRLSPNSSAESMAVSTTPHAPQIRRRLPAPCRAGAPARGTRRRARIRRRPHVQRGMVQGAAQREGRGDLAEDRADQQQPGDHVSPASRSRRARAACRAPGRPRAGRWHGRTRDHRPGAGRRADGSGAPRNPAGTSSHRSICSCQRWVRGHAASDPRRSPGPPEIAGAARVASAKTASGYRHARRASKCLHVTSEPVGDAVEHALLAALGHPIQERRRRAASSFVEKWYISPGLVTPAARAAESRVRVPSAPRCASAASSIASTGPTGRCAGRAVIAGGHPGREGRAYCLLYLLAR